MWGSSVLMDRGAPRGLAVFSMTLNFRFRRTVSLAADPDREGYDPAEPAGLKK
jgi:hypothetical protein